MSNIDENENKEQKNSESNNNDNESKEKEESENSDNNKENNNNNDNELEREENEDEDKDNYNNENTNNNNEEFFDEDETLNVTEFINDFKNREIEYNEKIKELEKDLLIERSKSDTTKNSSEKLIKKFKEEIAEKDKEIKIILSNNSKQRKQLEQLSKKVDAQLNKMNYKIISDKIKKEKMQNNIFNKLNANKIKTKNNSNKDLNTIKKEEESKMKDEQLKNVNKLIDILQTDNESLKKKMSIHRKFNKKKRIIIKKSRKKHKNHKPFKSIKKSKKRIERTFKLPNFKRKIKLRNHFFKRRTFESQKQKH